MDIVTAVIPTWNRRDLLEAALAGLRRQSVPLRALVVDNGSTDGSADAAEQAGAQVVRLERNEGFAVAANRGIREADPGWIAILNNDVDLAPDWAELLLDACNRTGSWFATGKILNAGDPTRLDGTFDLLARSGCAWRAGAGQLDGPQWNRERPIRFAPWTAVLFHSDVFQKTGLLDEEFGSYLEDVEFGVRCALAGCQGIYVPAAVCRHAGSATLGGWSPAMVERISRNQVLLASKHFPRDWFWPMLVGQVLWGGLAARRGTWSAWLNGKTGGLECIKGSTARVHPGIFGLIEESEAELHELQRRGGQDSYWKLYFALT